MITFFLVRHGEAESNASAILSSYPEVRDFHLTDKGRGQIEKTTEFLKSENIDAIIASPLLRTRESAEIISQAINVPVIHDIRLRETDFGYYNGKRAAMFFARYPHPLLRLKTNKKVGLEGFVSIRERVKDFLENVAEEYVGKRVVLVSHGDTLEQLRGAIEHRKIKTAALGWMPEKGSCTEVVWELD